MAPFLPPICDDETLRGYIRRVAAISTGRVATPDVLIRLIGQRLIHPSMPNNILAIVESIGGACGSPEEVLHEHTLFDYHYALARRHVVLDRASSMLGCQPGTRVPTRYPLVFSAADSVSPNCPLCDETTTDGVYLHTEFRVHLMPFQRYCPIHGQLLQYTDCMEPTIIANASRQVCRSRRLRQQNYDVKSMQWARSGLSERRALIAQQLQEKGYACMSGRIYRARLVADLQKFFGKGFVDDRLTSVANSPSMIYQFLDNWNKSDRVPATAIGILLEWYLEQCEALRAPSPRRASARVVADLSILSEDTTGSNNSIRSIAARQNIPYRTLLDAAIRAECRVTCRPKKFCLNLQEFAVAQLCSGMSRADVARSCNVSIQSIHRLCTRRGLSEQISAEADRQRRLQARAAWRNAFAESPGRSRTELRRVLRADWTWLRRHDSEWLESVEAMCTCCARAVRVRPHLQSTQCLAVTAAIEAAAKAELQSTTQPRRLSKTRLGKLSGVSSFVLDAVSVRGMATEADKDWVTRRLAWARQTLDAENLDAGSDNWRLWRTARIRPRSLQSI